MLTHSIKICGLMWSVNIKYLKMLAINLGKGIEFNFNSHTRKLVLQFLAMIQLITSKIFKKKSQKSITKK